MNTIYISNAPRGCGRLQKRGCYGISTLSASGTLALWTWLLAEPWDGGPRHNQHMIWCMGEIPARTQVSINPRVTLLHNELMYEMSSSEEIQKDKLSFVPDHGLADHIGSCFYTPWEFAEECVARGASRRFTPAMAKKMASQTPFLMFFSHHDIPIPEDRAEADTLLGQACGGQRVAPGPKTWGATWLEEGFGLKANDYHGGGHAMVDVLEYISAETSKTKGRKVPLQYQYEEAIFGASWITDVVQIVDENEEVHPALAGAGVEKGVLEDNDDFSM